MLHEKNYSPFYSAFLSLCTQKGVSPSVAARDSGISSGAPTAWKNGAIPKPAQREKLCLYFGVTDEVLLGYVQKEKTPISESGRKDELFGTDKYGKRLKVLARHLEKIPEETRNRLVKNFEDTIDTYLDAMGIPREDED